MSRRIVKDSCLYNLVNLLGLCCIHMGYVFRFNSATLNGTALLLIWRGDA